MQLDLGEVRGIFGFNNRVKIKSKTMNLTHCTLTGVDESTDLQKVVHLSVEFPLIEWGFLYSPKRQGQPGRYPSISMLRRSLANLPLVARCALHICGRGVSDLLEGEAVAIGLVDLVEARGGRVQLNFNHTKEPIDLQALWRLLLAHPSLTLITQHNEGNQNLWTELGAGFFVNHAALFDTSGGRGVLATEWPAPLPISCGYAGGLSGANLCAELSRIADKVGERDTWVDMEGSLRSHDAGGQDWLNLEACKHAIEAATLWYADQQALEKTV